MNSLEVLGKLLSHDENSAGYRPSHEFSQVALGRLEEVRYSAEQNVPIAYELMIKEHPNREAQVTNITSRVDLFSKQLGFSKDPRQGDASAMQRVINGADAGELLGQSPNNVIDITDRLPQQGVSMVSDADRASIAFAPENATPSIAELNEKAKLVAFPRKEADIVDPDNPHSVDEVAHVA